MNYNTERKKHRTLSLVSRGARFQFEIAVVLTLILPLLTFSYLYHRGIIVIKVLNGHTWGIISILVVIMCLGYVLLVKYPRTIIKLRKYLQSIASGEMPEVVALLAKESDIISIENYFNMIIGQMKKRISRIHEQGEKLIEAERQRVMMESLCTACHHLGQPATTIACYLEFLKAETLSPGGSENLAKCVDEVHKMGNILAELQNINEYRTESYCEIDNALDLPHTKMIATNK